jgi:hypothetical protein
MTATACCGNVDKMHKMHTVSMYRFMIVCYCLRASFILLALQSSPVCHFPLSPAAAARVLAAHVFVTLNPLRVPLTPLEVFF